MNSNTRTGAFLLFGQAVVLPVLAYWLWNMPIYMFTVNTIGALFLARGLHPKKEHEWEVCKGCGRRHPTLEQIAAKLAKSTGVSVSFVGPGDQLVHPDDEDTPHVH